jgi:hypothetical protein
VPQPVISAGQYSHLVRERIAALRQLRLDLTRGAPQSAPRRFFRSVEILIGAIERVFASRSKDIEHQSISEVEKDSKIAFAARLTMKLLNDVQEQLFPFLERLDSPHVPLAILPAMQRIARQYETQVELYLFPTSEHNFGFSGFRNLIQTFLQRFDLIVPDDLKAELLKEAEQLPRWLVFLSFPYVVHDSALHLTPLLHELGHFADFQLGIYRELLPIDVSTIEAAKRLVDEILQTPLSHERARVDSSQQPGVDARVGQIVQREVVEQQVFAQCSEIIHRWIHELISDLFALRIGGPAYFYSFVAFAANVGLEVKAAMTHPSPAIRIDFMVKELKELGYLSDDSGDSLDKIRPSLRHWEGWIETQKLAPDSGLARVAYEAVDKNAAKLAEAVRKHSSPFCYDTKTYNQRVPGVVGDLQLGIPPIDRSGDRKGVFRPCDFADILNGAWTTYMFSPDILESLLDCPDDERKLRATSILNQLVLKAIEASEILRVCQKSRRRKV